MVTRDEVISAFRLLLGRDPESDAVVEQLSSAPSWEILRRTFLESTEFNANWRPNDFGDSSLDFANAPPNLVDVEISAAHLELLVEHVQRSWEALGRTQPHWSVLTNPEFSPDKIETNVANFYSSGEHCVKILERAAARAGRELSSNLTCFELGCGVGRVTAYLANRFEYVIAADISAPHLALADTYLCSKKLKNVTLLQLRSLVELHNLAPIDIFYSLIVLQHNPPPLIYRMLQLVFSKVRMRGCVYFQVPVAYPNYRFSINEYLSIIDNNEGNMEMHALPQVYLFRVLDEHGFRILDLQRDRWTGPGFHSITVFAEKIR
jgi:SAM-dependent methyltransferase